VNRQQALWIALHLPHLALETFAATLLPEQQGLPMALLRGARLAAVDEAAAGLGLKSGMRRATAMALAPRTIFGHADAVREDQGLQAVAHASLAFTPSVTLHGRRTVLLEVATTQRAFGGLPRLIDRLLAFLSPLGLTVRLATAPTAMAAAILVRWGRPDIPVVGEHTHRLEALRNLIDEAPLITLHSAWEHLDSLQAMGLSTLAELRTLPRDGLVRRFGPAVLAELDAARGEAAQAHAWLTLPDGFDSRLELFARADTADQVLYGAQLLLARLVAWARARRGRVRRLQLQMLHEPRHRHDDRTPECTTLEIALAEPSNDAVHIGVLLREHLCRLPLPAPTLELRMNCQDLAFSDAPSGELFPTRDSEHEGLLRLVERLQARLGRERVRRVHPVADHRPEHSTVLLPLEPSQTDGAGTSAVVAACARLPAAASPSSGSPLTRPVWLLAQPQPLADRQSAPWFDGRPLQVLSGPERIEAGWWDGEPVVRDYFVAQAHDGSVVWIYRSRLPVDGLSGSGGSTHPASAGEWFLHGRFA
jgi:protein ImuB